LGKCPQIGEAGGYATWYRDNINVEEFVHKNGLMYAHIEYLFPTSQYPQRIARTMQCDPHPEFNPNACGRGLFRHDMVENKWYRVANLNMSSAYWTPKCLTNGTDILVLGNYGKIYLIDESEPDGWRLLTPVPLKENQFFRNTGSSNNFDWRDLPDNYNSGTPTYSFMGDTIFFLIVHGQSAGAQALAEQGLVKYCYKTNTLVFDSIGHFPGQTLYNSFTCGKDPDGTPPYVATSRCWDGGHFARYALADHIAGRFVVFARYRDALNRDSCWYETSRRGEYNSVRVNWTWDPVRKQWFNISEGPDWRNLTPSSCTGDGGFFPSWDKKKMFMSVQQGIYEWRGDKYELKAVGGWYNVGPTLAVYEENDPFNYVTFVNKSRESEIELIDYANRIRLGQTLAACKFESIGDIATPDNGQTLYLELTGQLKDTSLVDD
jgi:hypothetical protein